MFSENAQWFAIKNGHLVKHCQGECVGGSVLGSVRRVCSEGGSPGVCLGSEGECLEGGRVCLEVGGVCLEGVEFVWKWGECV